MFAAYSVRYIRSRIVSSYSSLDLTASSYATDNVMFDRPLLCISLTQSSSVPLYDHQFTRTNSSPCKQSSCPRLIFLLSLSLVSLHSFSPDLSPSFPFLSSSHLCSSIAPPSEGAGA
eukprot:763392-Hanusia_phi.AAC.6